MVVNFRRSHLEHLKYKKPFGGRGSAPDSVGEAYIAPRTPSWWGEEARCPSPRTNPSSAFGPHA